MLLSMAGFASTEVEKTFGLLGGLSLSKLSYENGSPSDYRKGPLFGLDIEFPLSSHIFFVPSVYAVQKGDENPLGSTQLSYLELALTPKIKSSSDGTGLYFLIGPYLATILSRNQTSTSGAQTALSSDQVKNSEGGIVAGVGFETLLSHHYSLYLEGRYSMGMSSSLEGTSAKNQGLYINLGFHYIDREDIESNLERAEEFVKKKSEPSATSPIE